MKKILSLNFIFLCCFFAQAQQKKSPCNISIISDEFTGTKKIVSSNTILLEKLYLAESLFGMDKEPWRITIGFFKEDAPLLVVRHETNEYKGTSTVDVLDIKFSDGSVLSFDKPIEGVRALGSLKENTNQKTFFKLTNEQLRMFMDKLIVKSRVKFKEHPNEPEFQKELVKIKAEKIQSEAKCFAEAIVSVK